MPITRATRTAALAGGTAVVGAGATWAIVGSGVSVVAQDSYGQLALDSTAATTGLLLAYLLYGRFAESRARRDLLLGSAVLLLAAGNAVFAVLPLVVGGERRTTASALLGVFSGMLFAAAVWSPPATLAARARRVVPAVVATVVGAVALSWLLSELLPRPGVGSADTFGSGPDAGINAAQVLAATAFGVAAVGWCRPRVQDDGLAPAMAVAGVLGWLSRLDFAVASSGDSPWVTAATLLRLAFYATLLGCALAQIRGYWARLAEAAVLEERRRMARELHDGLAQELAFTATQARALADRSEHPQRAHIVMAAAERALDESRRAIAALTRPLDEPLDAAVAQCAEEVCGRFETALVLDVEPGVQASPDAREGLLRIVREAVTNAGRHGAARTVAVRLTGDGPLRLVVEDDGSGFDPTDLRHLSGRFGLVSMRERTEALGGSFALTSRSPGGTTVEVVLPCR